MKAVCWVVAVSRRRRFEFFELFKWGELVRRRGGGGGGKLMGELFGRCFAHVFWKGCVETRVVSEWCVVCGVWKCFCCEEPLSFKSYPQWFKRRVRAGGVAAILK